MPRESGADRDDRCKCGHLKIIHPTGRCIACDCSQFVDENDSSVLTLDPNELDR